MKSPQFIIINGNIFVNKDRIGCVYIDNHILETQKKVVVKLSIADEKGSSFTVDGFETVEEATDWIVKTFCLGIPQFTLKQNGHTDQSLQEGLGYMPLGKG